MLEEKIYKDNQEPPKNVIWHKVSDAGQDLGYYKNINNKWNKIDINEGGDSEDIDNAEYYKVIRHPLESDYGYDLINEVFTMCSMWKFNDKTIMPGFLSSVVTGGKSLCDYLKFEPIYYPETLEYNTLNDCLEQYNQKNNKTYKLEEFVQRISKEEFYNS